MVTTQVKKKSAIFLMGPTASGKTQLAIDLLERLPCEIISVDSALIYRGMDIGTAKPDAETLRQAPHRLIDIRDPNNVYSAADFRDDALRAMEEISNAGKIPLLVGGTMMYFKCLLEGMADLPKASQVVRDGIEQDAARYGWSWVHERLVEVDPESAKRIHPNDPQRLQRAYEIYLTTGKTMTALWADQANTKVDFPYKTLQLAMTPTDRALLHERIGIRFQAMLKQGFVEEVESLRREYVLNLNMPSMRAVGYRQVWEYIDGVMDYNQMAERGIIATRQLAKRQLTWLRSWQNLCWLATDSDKIVEDALKKIDANAISAT